jgi:predicted methyltransferase
MFLVAALALVACAEPAPPSPPTPASAEPAPVSPAPSDEPTEAIPAHIRAAVDAADRTDEDRALDAGRRPAEMLAFYGVKPGMRVAELMAGRGYTAELLARTVGPKGTVYGHNNAFVLEKFAEQPWTDRLTKQVNANVVRVDRELESPLPPEAKELDAVFLVLFYHDTVWMKTDRAKMNAAIFEALRPGGLYAVVDHSASDGAGVEHVKTLHRIEEKIVRSEIEAAGFELRDEASFLRNPEDARDWNASPSASGDRRGTSDRFVLAFVKPK